MFKPFSIREIYRYIVPGVLIFYLIIYPYTDYLFPLWASLNVTEKFIVAIISGVMIGFLLEPVMTFVGMYILSHPSLILNHFKMTIDTETLERNVILLRNGIWILIDESERELLWHNTAMYYLYASFPLILFINAILMIIVLIADNWTGSVLMIIVLFVDNWTNSKIFIIVLSVVLGYASLKQLILYLEINNNYLSYISRKYKEKIKDLLSPEELYKYRTTRLHKITPK